jgi:hypothetical protein
LTFAPPADRQFIDTPKAGGQKSCTVQGKLPSAPSPSATAQAFSPIGSDVVTQSTIEELFADASKPDGDAAGAGSDISPAIPLRWSGHALFAGLPQPNAAGIVPPQTTLNAVGRRKRPPELLLQRDTASARLRQPNAAGIVPPGTTLNAVHALDDVHASRGTIPSHHGKSEAPPHGTLLTFVSDKD